MKINRIVSSSTSRIVLVGDLSGFSYSFDQGNTFLVSEFIKRFYFLVSGVIDAAGGELIKFTGDGFLAVWPLTRDMKKSSVNTRLAYSAAHELSRLIRITKLGLNITDCIVLRQGITVEPHALKLKIDTTSGPLIEYLGNMINVAFRIQALAVSYPYVSLHKDFVDLLGEDAFDKLHILEIDKNELDRVFKNVPTDSRSIFLEPSFPEDRLNQFIVQTKLKIEKGTWSESDTNKSQVVQLQFKIEKPRNASDKHLKTLLQKLNKFYRSGPSWLNDSYFFYRTFIKTLEHEVYERLNGR